MGIEIFWKYAKQFYSRHLKEQSARVLEPDLEKIVNRAIASVSQDRTKAAAQQGLSRLDKGTLLDPDKQEKLDTRQPRRLLTFDERLKSLKKVSCYVNVLTLK